MKKPIAVLLAVLLVVGVAIGGTMAWLTSTPDPVENIFTTGDVDITLTETKGGENKEFQMIPGWTIEKDPTVTVDTSSEDCMVFVKLVKSGGDITIGETTYNFDSFLSYEIADDWTQLPTDKDGKTLEGVYYRTVSKDDEIKQFSVIANDTVNVSADVTKAMMNALEADTSKRPKLTVTAYAIQLKQSNEQEFAPADAWAAVQPTN